LLRLQPFLVASVFQIHQHVSASGRKAEITKGIAIGTIFVLFWPHFFVDWATTDAPTEKGQENTPQQPTVTPAILGLDHHGQGHGPSRGGMFHSSNRIGLNHGVVVAVVSARPVVGVGTGGVIGRVFVVVVVVVVFFHGHFLRRHGALLFGRGWVVLDRIFFTRPLSTLCGVFGNRCG